MSIALIFPPIVNSGFGSYYPALPVLAASLAARGHSVAQVDLNEDLAVHLLDPERLQRCGNGDFYAGENGRRDAHDIAAVAARLLLRNRAQLFDLEGRHRFAERRSSPAYLLSVLAQAYVVDRSVTDAVAAVANEDPLAEWYSGFYSAQNLEAVLPADCSLIGLSVPMGPQLFPALVLARQLRLVRPDARVVLGGPTMSLMQEDAIELILGRCQGVDAIVRYEGELPLLKLAEQAEEGEWAPHEAPGTSCVQDGKIVHRPPVPGVALDTLPFAAYDLGLVARLSDPELGVVQTRGCYWGQCAYCDFVELYDGSARFRGRSPESFVSEVEHHIKSHGARRFSLITEAIPPSFALKFSELVISRGLDIAWSSFAMVDRHFGNKHFDAMARSGCDHLVIGLETMTDRVLHHVHKYANSEDNARFLRAASDAGISVLVNLIPDLPTTTYAEALQTLERMVALEGCLSGVAVFPFEATRSSQVGRTPERYGLIGIAGTGTSGQAVFADNHLQIVDEGMTPDERLEVHRRFALFADRVNARGAKGTALRGTASTPGSRFVFARDDVDVVQSGGLIHFFNWRTRQRWEASAGLSRVMEHAETLGPSFTRDEILAGAARPTELGYLVDAMIEAGVFVAPSGPP
jgi:hypothetical protein